MVPTVPLALPMTGQNVDTFGIPPSSPDTRRNDRDMTHTDPSEQADAYEADDEPELSPAEIREYERADEARLDAEDEARREAWANGQAEEDEADGPL